MEGGGAEGMQGGVSVVQGVGEGWTRASLFGDGFDVSAAKRDQEIGAAGSGDV